MRRPRTFKPRTRKPKQLALSIVKAPGFYASPAWLELRYRALRLSNGRCECCGARATSANPLHVDHIRPRSRYPERELDLTNLQVLCRQCNLGKRDSDTIDWRRA